jgi:hypothetical protein
MNYNLNKDCDLKLWLPLNRDFYDASRYGNTITKNGSCILHPRVGSICGDFTNQSTDYLNCGNPANLQFVSGDVFTASFWFYSPNNLGSKFLFGHGTSSYTLYLASISNITFSKSTVGNSGNLYTLPNVASTYTKWYHIVIINRVGTDLTLYVNGKLVKNVSWTYTYSYTQNLRINNSQSDSNGTIPMRYRDIRFYSRALTNNEVLALYYGAYQTVKPFYVSATVAANKGKYLLQRMAA